jgi:hypothetical protein
MVIHDNPLELKVPYVFSIFSNPYDLYLFGESVG